MAIYCDMRVESDDDVWQACLTKKAVRVRVRVAWSGFVCRDVSRVVVLVCVYELRSCG
jgi:hypothetical protein